MKRCCIVGFVPDPSYPGAEAFLANIREFKTHYDLLLASHHPYGPDLMKWLASPVDQMKGAKYPDGKPNQWGTNNLVFLTCVRMAMLKGYEWLIYVEADGRVLGDCWDKIMFDEFFTAGEGKLIGGTAVVYNGSNRSMAFTRRWRDFLVLNANSPWPIPAYGGNGAAEKHEPAVFVNGAFGIYSIDFLKSIYDLENTGKVAAETTAFDYFIGRELVRKYGDEAFNYIAHLSSIYSGYGDVATTPTERQEMLQSGQVVASHQHKSNWKPERRSGITWKLAIPQRFIPGAEGYWDVVKYSDVLKGNVAERETQQLRPAGAGALLPEGQAGDEGSTPSVATNQVSEEVFEKRMALCKNVGGIDPNEISNGGVAQRLDASVNEESGRQSHYTPSHAGSTPAAPTNFEPEGSGLREQLESISDGSVTEKSDANAGAYGRDVGECSRSHAGSNPATPAPKVSKPRWKRNSL